MTKQNQITVHKGRHNTVTVSVGYDVSQGDITSQIRTEKDRESTLIATWDVAKLTDGTDGELVLTMSAETSGAVTQFKGYMDLKRVVGENPISVFDDPVEVLFKEVVTA